MIKASPENTAVASVEAADIEVREADRGLDNLKQRRQVAADTLAGVQAECVAVRDQFARDPSDGVERRLAKITTLVAQSEAALAALDDQIIPLAEKRVSSARKALRRAEVRQTYSEAETLVGETVERLEAEYPALMEQLASLARAVDATNLVVRTANASLPAHFKPLREPESVARDRTATSKRQVSKELVELWVAHDSGRKIEDARIPEIRLTGPGVGTLEWAGITPRSPAKVRLQKHWKISFEPSKPKLSAPRLTEMTFPALRAGDPSYWSPAADAQQRSAAADRERTLAIEFIVADDWEAAQ